MKRTRRACIAPLVLALTFICNIDAQQPATEKGVSASTPKAILLPSPRRDSTMSVEKALSERRSLREYSDEALTLPEISQLLWAAQGITNERDAPSRWNQDYEWQGGYRTAPSAGALFPLELYVVAANVDGLSQGVYKFVPKDHSIIKVADGDKRGDIFNVGLKQASIKHAPALIIIAAVYERTLVKYGDRSERYIFIETGHVGQNIYLQSAALEIGAVMDWSIRRRGSQRSPSHARRRRTSGDHAHGPSEKEVTLV